MANRQIALVVGWAMSLIVVNTWGAVTVFTPEGYPTAEGPLNTGFYFWGSRPNDYVASGVAAGNAQVTVANGGGSRRAVLFSSDGQITPLQPPAGKHSTEMTDANRAGQVIGSTDGQLEYVVDPPLPMFWDRNGAATVLPLGIDSRPTSYAWPLAINDHGMIVGGATRESIAGPTYLYPVRWDSPMSAPIELEAPSDGGYCVATNVNNNGMVIGSIFNRNAVRWQPGSTAIEYLESDDFYSGVNALNDAGVAVGQINAGAAKWNPGSTALIKLDSHDPNFASPSNAQARDINSHGTIIGISTGSYATGRLQGYRGVLWEHDSTTLVSLPLPIINGSGIPAYSTKALQINDAGYIVGTAKPTDDPRALDREDRAVLWTPDGQAIDLNSFLPAGSLWVLNVAYDISDDNWVTGLGSYNTSAPRLFMIHVPEPVSFPIVLAAALVTRRFRWTRKAGRVRTNIVRTA